MSGTCNNQVSVYIATRKAGVIFYLTARKI